MNIIKQNILYFSPTYSTKNIVNQIASKIQVPQQEEFDITQYELIEFLIYPEMQLGANELLIVGVPVYYGRVPEQSLELLNRFKGNNTPAIIVCVYGNRAYDDALLELKNIVETNGFKVISAGAFIAKHAIFNTIASDRPDNLDKDVINDFGVKNDELLKNISDISMLSNIQIKGNFPYKPINNVYFSPQSKDSCNYCGTCVDLCPTTAIKRTEPRKTIEEKCITCGRCIVSCVDRKARYFAGEKYDEISKKYEIMCQERKEPEVIFCNY